MELLQETDHHHLIEASLALPATCFLDDAFSSSSSSSRKRSRCLQLLPSRNAGVAVVAWSSEADS